MSGEAGPREIGWREEFPHVAGLVDGLLRYMATLAMCFAVAGAFALAHRLGLFNRDWSLSLAVYFEGWLVGGRHFDWRPKDRA